MSTPSSSKLKQSRLTFSSWEPLRRSASQRSSSQPASPRSSLPPSSPPPAPAPRESPARSTPLRSSQPRRTRLKPVKLQESSDDEGSDTDDFNAVRLGPRSPSKPAQRRGRFFSDDERTEPTPRKRVAPSDDEASEKSESSVEFLGSDPESVPSRPSAKAKGKQKATPRRPVDPDSDDDRFPLDVESSADERPRRTSRRRPRRRYSDSEDEGFPLDDESEDERPRRTLRRRPKRRYSDNEDGGLSLDDEFEDERPRRSRRRPYEKASNSDSPPPRRLRRRSNQETSSPRKRRRSSFRPDPDDEPPASAATEDEDARAEIEMDEPERFTAATRLRGTKESAWAAHLRRLKESRDGNAAENNDDKAVEYISSGSEEGEDDSAEENGDELDDFLVSDDGEMAEELPEEFSHKRESTEYKFKVVFQYLLLLAIKGPDILPLNKSNADYFGRQLRDVRNLMKGFRDSVASTLWRPEFRKALDTYPVWKQADLTEREEYCDGCNRRNQHCFRVAWLRGRPYDRESHEVLDDDSSSEDDDSDNSDDEKRDPRVLGNMGNKCIQRAHDFHELQHWEHQMFCHIKSQYNDLVRAKGRQVRESSLDSDSEMSDDARRELARRRRKSAGRVKRLQHGYLPNDVNDVDEVTEWMDTEGVMLKSLEWLGRVENRARRLEQHY